MHWHLNWKNQKKDGKRKNIHAMDSRNKVEKSNVDKNIVCTTVQKEVNLSILHH